MSNFNKEKSPPSIAELLLHPSKDTDTDYSISLLSLLVKKGIVNIDEVISLLTNNLKKIGEEKNRLIMAIDSIIGASSVKAKGKHSELLSIFAPGRYDQINVEEQLEIIKNSAEYFDNLFDAKGELKLKIVEEVSKFLLFIHNEIVKFQKQEDQQSNQNS